MMPCRQAATPTTSRALLAPTTAGGAEVPQPAPDVVPMPSPHPMPPAPPPPPEIIEPPLPGQPAADPAPVQPIGAAGCPGPQQRLCQQWLQHVC